MMASVLALVGAETTEAESSSVETLAQQALDKLWKEWLERLPHTHKREMRGTELIEWDEYDLKWKSPINKTILRKFSHNICDFKENIYQIRQVDYRGGVSIPSDDSLRKMLRENKIANLENYVGILENVAQYKKNNIEATLIVSNFCEEKGRYRDLRIYLFANNGQSGIAHFSIAGEVINSLLVGPLEKMPPKKIAYLHTVAIGEGYQGRGLSYPLMCVGFQAAKDIYGSEYMILWDVADKPGIYEKMGFRHLIGAGEKRKYAATSDLLNSDKCKNMNR